MWFDWLAPELFRIITNDGICLKLEQIIRWCQNDVLQNRPTQIQEYYLQRFICCDIYSLIIWWFANLIWTTCCFLEIRWTRGQGQDYINFPQYNLSLWCLGSSYCLLFVCCLFFHLSASVNEVYGHEWTCLSSTETEQSYNSWHVEIPIRDAPSPLCRLRGDPTATDKRIWEELMSFFYYCKNKFLLIYVWVTKHHRVDNSRTLSGPTRHMLTHTISWSVWW